MPENRLVSDGNRKPTASVFIRVKGAAALSPSSVSSIRFLVANSVEGLQVNNVSVVDNLGNVLSADEDNDSIAGLSNNQLTARRNVEQYLTKKAQGMLESVLGQGQAVVRVSAELNWDTLTRSEEKFDPDGQVVRTSTINDESSDVPSTSNSGGPPVTGSNGDTNTASVPPVKNHMQKKMTESKYEINNISTKLVQAAGGIKRLSTAVFIAQRFTGTGADRKPDPRTPEELLKLTHIVQSALGIQETGDATRKDELTLEEMPFNGQETVELSQQLEKQEKRQFWVELGQKIIYPALAAGVLFLFWRLWKQTDEIPIVLPMTNGNGRAKNGSNSPGVVTVEVLNQLIRENPANMSQAVRSWLSRGKTET
jgi:flagellar M-ring protein FliF